MKYLRIVIGAAFTFIKLTLTVGILKSKSNIHCKKITKSFLRFKCDFFTKNSFESLQKLCCKRYKGELYIKISMTP